MSHKTQQVSVRVVLDNGYEFAVAVSNHEHAHTLIQGNSVILDQTNPAGPAYIPRARVARFHIDTK